MPTNSEFTDDASSVLNFDMEALLRNIEQDKQDDVEEAPVQRRSAQSMFDDDYSVADQIKAGNSITEIMRHYDPNELLKSYSMEELLKNDYEPAFLLMAGVTEEAIQDLGYEV